MENVIYAKDLHSKLRKAMVIDIAERHLRELYPECKIDRHDSSSRGGYDFMVSKMSGAFVYFYFYVVVGVRFNESAEEPTEVVYKIKDGRTHEVSEWLLVDRDVMSGATHYYECHLQAKQNLKKPYTEWKVGDCIFGTNDNSKLCDVRDYLKNFVKYCDTDRYNAPALLRIERIKEMTDEELMEKNIFFDRNPQLLEGFTGGSCSEDIPEGVDINNSKQYAELPYPIRHSFVQHVMLVRTPTRWVAIDPQGYDYCRYVHFPLDFHEMYAAEIATITKEVEHAAMLEQQCKDRNRMALELEYMARSSAAMRSVNTDKLTIPTNYYDRRTRVANVKKILAAQFPGNKFSVSFPYRTSWDTIEVSCEGDLDKKVLEKFCEVFKGDAYDEGETDNYGYPCKTMRHNEVTQYTRCFSSIYVR